MCTCRWEERGGRDKAILFIKRTGSTQGDSERIDSGRQGENSGFRRGPSEGGPRESQFSFVYGCVKVRNYVDYQ